MKKLLILLICTTLLFLCACANAPTIEVVAPAEDAPEQPMPDEDPAAVEPTVQPTPDVPPPPPVPTVTPIAPPPSPTPPSGPRMYTSNAHMVSFNPSTGVAEFDFFDKLRDQAAIDWMVDHEGYSVVDATNIVNNFADSEFVYKNTNPQLRTIDLDDQPLKLMYDVANLPMFENSPISATTADAAALYAIDPAYLFDTFDFIIHVNGSDSVTLVEQIYWP